MRKEEFPHLQWPKTALAEAQAEPGSQQPQQNVLSQCHQHKTSHHHLSGLLLQDKPKVSEADRQSHPKSSKVTNPLLLPLVLAGFQAIAAQQWPSLVKSILLFSLNFCFPEKAAAISLQLCDSNTWGTRLQLRTSWVGYLSSKEQKFLKAFSFPEGKERLDQQRKEGLSWLQTS